MHIMPSDALLVRSFFFNDMSRQRMCCNTIAASNTHFVEKGRLMRTGLRGWSRSRLGSNCLMAISPHLGPLFSITSNLPQHEDLLAAKQTLQAI